MSKQTPNTYGLSIEDALKHGWGSRQTKEENVQSLERKLREQTDRIEELERALRVALVFIDDEHPEWETGPGVDSVMDTIRKALNGGGNE